MKQPDDWIKHLSKWLRGQVVNFGVLEVEGLTCNYILVDHNIPGVPRWFVGRDKPSGFYFISDEVPRDHRFLVLRHEMFEFEILGGSGEGCCQRALFYELAHCPPELLAAHIALRQEMFQVLLAWINASADRRAAYTQEQIDEMARAARRLMLMRLPVD